MSLNWKTDEDAWDEAEADRLDASGRRRWLPLLLLGGLLIVLGAAILPLVWRNIGNEVSVQVDLLEQQVLDSHFLLEDTLRSGDPRTVEQYISGSDPEWAYGLLDTWAGIYPTLYFPVFGFGEKTATTESVVFEDGYREAVVTITQSWEPHANDSGESFLHLSMPYVYRLSQNGWIIAKPTADFWGRTQLIEGEYLDVTVNERDAGVVAVLVTRFDEVYAQFCADFRSLSCREGKRYHVELSTDWWTVDSLRGHTNALSNSSPGDPDFVLPTISLVGVPENAYSMNQVVDRYVSFVILAGLNADYPDTNNLSYMLLDEYFEQHGIVPPLYFSRALYLLTLPVLPRDQIGVEFDRPEVSSRFLSNYGDSRALQPALGEPSYSSLNKAQASEILSFVFDKAPPSIGWDEYWEITIQADSFEDWLESIFDRPYQEIEQLFLEHQLQFYPHSAEAAEPNHSIVALCGLNLARNMINSDEWELNPLNENFEHQLTSLPNGGYLLSSYPLPQAAAADAEWTITIDMPQLDRPLELNEANYDVTLRYAGQQSPDGRWLLFESENRNTGLTDFDVLDIELCKDGDCVLRPVDGRLLWSPDGESTLIVERSRIFIGDGLGQSIRRVERGFFPTWIDNEQFAYLHSTRPQNRNGVLRAEIEMVIVSVDESVPIKTLAVNDVLPYLTENDTVENTQIALLANSPNENQMLLAISTENRQVIDIFFYDVRNGGLEKITRVPSANFLRQIVSQPGAPDIFMQMTGQSDDSLFYRVIKQDLEDSITSYPNPPADIDPDLWRPEWTPDGRYAILPSYIGFDLIDAELYTSIPLKGPGQSCQSAVWGSGR